MERIEHSLWLRMMTVHNNDGMTQCSDLFSQAVACHSNGQFHETERLCREALAVDPNHADAWHLLGIVAMQHSSGEVAAEHLKRSVELNPNNAEAQNNLGVVLRGLGKYQEAILAFHRALLLSPSFLRVIHNLANTLEECGETAGALTCFRHAVQLSPGEAIGWYGLGRLLAQTAQIGEAANCYQRAVELQPNYADAHDALGNLCQKAEQYELAISCYLRALECDPNRARTVGNLGTVLKISDRFAEATSCFRRALALEPDNLEMRHNLACGLLIQGALDEAGVLWDSVLAMEPTHAEARFNRALLWLAVGDFERGLPDLEWRWRTEQQEPRAFSQPLWQGESLVGRTILLWAEQGFGDAIQFIRYAEIVKQRGGTVVVECLRGLKSILAGCLGIDVLLEEGDQLPAFDVHLPLLSLPWVVGTTFETIPAETPYLFAKPELVQEWSQRLAHLSGPRIGINWRGRAGRGTFRQRDLPFESFMMLGEALDITFVSLQRGEGRQDLLQSANGNAILDLGDDVDRDHGAFMDTAAIMKNVDLVITSDTAVAHLAGALAVPVWLALPFAADWRWFLNRTDSPWYPTMRLFRQPAARDWAAVFAEIEGALRALAK